jgi:maleylpyruvate isomerase
MADVTDPTARRVDLDDLSEAGQRLTRTIDGFSGEDWQAASLLPGWSRAHVVAHLALNGEALGGVLRGIAEGEAAPMYETAETREADIAELAGADAAELRDRLLASLTTFLDAVESVPEDGWSAHFERTRGDGTRLPAHAVPLMRWRELEVHHADLDAGYTPADWSATFSELVVTGMVKRLDPEEGFRVAPLDASRTWDVGTPAADPVVVTGPVADVAWWLTGRAPSDQVSSSRGVLPTIGGW